MRNAIVSALLFIPSVALSAQCPAFLNYDLPRLHSDETVNICQQASGKPLLIVNTASHCGFTKQFEGLEDIHQTYKDRDLMVVGFASNDFNQEAKTEEEAAKVCRENFGVTFTMVAPSYVKGQRANPVFREINRQSEEPSWNFNKYLINANGEVVKHFGSRVAPDDASLHEAIESML
ncbi:glutathione peroxidase [uncultured Methylophaga sp.]|jgi:glutathione peroxidase|uniref:glutathione peroxidase n=1 Tax=uncultured Methylophaga sp. TaxID=285271 RepID=UPI002610FF26|nr:glutathione peroxidase [uncultured Methylophaga sp.]